MKMPIQNLQFLLLMIKLNYLNFKHFDHIKLKYFMFLNHNEQLNYLLKNLFHLIFA